MIRTTALAVLLLGCDPGVEPRPARLSQPSLTDGSADSVFGQLTLNVGTEPAVTNQTTTHFPIAVAANLAPPKPDPNPFFYIADQGANRVLGVYSLSKFASAVAGQFNFNARLPNQGGTVSQPSLHAPAAVAFFSNQLAIADAGNHRVLLGYRSDSLGWPPRVVFGQLGRFDTNEANKGGAITRETLNEPSGVAFDATFYPGRLLIADTGNHRVLTFLIEETAPWLPSAQQCLGQEDCTKGVANRGGSVSRLGLRDPRGLATDNRVEAALRGFYVADTGNHRVLHFPAFSTTPDRVYGQGNDFNSAIPSKGGVSADSLNSPTAVAVDKDGSIYVADTGHHRVLHFPPGVTTADRAYGQPDLKSGAPPSMASATRMSSPSGVALTTAELIVADTGFSRVLRFKRPCGCDDGDPCTDDSCDGEGNCIATFNQWSRECAPYFCDKAKKQCTRPCDTTHPCAPPYQCINGTCAIRCVDERPCLSAGRTCTDGYCCDRPCKGTCERCNEPSNEGTCRIVAEGPPAAPRSCSGIGGECGMRCNGFEGASCAIARAGAACGTESCSGSLLHKRGSCDGSGTCNAVTAECFPYACEVSACRTTCRFDFDCAEGARCSAGVCGEGLGGAAAGGGCGFDPRANAAAALIVGVALAVSLRRRR